MLITIDYNQQKKQSIKDLISQTKIWKENCESAFVQSNKYYKYYKYIINKYRNIETKK